MRRTLLIVAALTGGPFVFAAPPVVEVPVNTAPAPAAVQPVQGGVASQPGPVARPAANPSAELLLMIEQLQEEVRFLRGRLEEQQYKLRQMEEAQRDRYRDLDRRLSLFGEQLEEVRRQEPQAPQVTLPGTGVARPVTAASSAPAASAPQPTISDTQAYRDAFSLVRTREYDAALEAFAAFRTVYPDSPLVANVLYWSGEVNRVKNPADLAAARAAYAELIQRFPDHAKVPDALYKLGLTEAALGNAAEARKAMEQVVARFPQHQSAKLAREYLAK